MHATNKSVLTGAMPDIEAAEVELHYKSIIKPSQRPVIKTAKDTVGLLRAHWDANLLELQEQFKVLLLNISNQVVGIYHLSTGGTSTTVVDNKLIFAAALKTMANKIIIAHNHPSGSAKPSQEDIILTKRLRESAKLLDIQLLDHIILTIDSFCSFCDEDLF